MLGDDKLESLEESLFYHLPNQTVVSVDKGNRKQEGDGFLLTNRKGKCVHCVCGWWSIEAK